MADDEETRVIGLYIDGVKDLDAFEEAVSYAKAKGMRIALIKSGSNEMTRLLTKNHTGSVESFSNERFNALLKQYGITRCRDLEELIYTLCTYAYCRNLPKGKRVAAITLSGGEAALMGETAEGFDLVFPPFDEALTAYLEERLPAYAHVSNPLDMTAVLSYDAEILADALIHVMKQPQIDTILFGYTLLVKEKLLAIVIAFSLNYAAYFAEIYRGGIESMPVGQYEAATVLGYSKGQTFMRIILPQVIKRILPSVTNEVITLVKDTSMAFTLAYMEMFSIGKQIANSQSSFLPFVIAGVFYYLMNMIVAFAMSRCEKALSYYR